MRKLNSYESNIFRVAIALGKFPAEVAENMNAAQLAQFVEYLDTAPLELGDMQAQTITAHIAAMLAGYFSQKHVDFRIFMEATYREQLAEERAEAKHKHDTAYKEMMHRQMLERVKRGDYN